MADKTLPVSRFLVPTLQPSPVLNSEPLAPADLTIVRAIVGDNEVRYIRSDGSTAVKSGGSLTWRYNNPGALRRSPTALTVSGGFAVFASPELGFTACKELLRKDYDGLTVTDLVAKYAPASENNVDAYAQYIAERLRVKPDDTLDFSDGSVLDACALAIQSYEGWKVGSTVPVPTPDASPTQATEPDKDKESSLASALATGAAVASAAVVAAVVAGLLTGVIQSYARKRRFQPGVGGLWTKLAVIPSLANPLPLVKIGTYSRQSPVGLWRVYERISLIPAVTVVTKNGRGVREQQMVVDSWGGWGSFSIKSGLLHLELLETTLNRFNEPGPSSDGTDGRWLVSALDRDTFDILELDLSSEPVLQDYWVAQRIGSDA